MFLVILLTPLVFLTCWALPFVGTVFSREQSSKWIAFWLLQIAASWTLIPFLGLIFECEVQMVAKIVVALALIFVLNPALVLLPFILGRHHHQASRGSGRHRQSAEEERRGPNLQSRQAIRTCRMISITAICLSNIFLVRLKIEYWSCF